MYIYIDIYIYIYNFFFFFFPEIFRQQYMGFLAHMQSSQYKKFLQEHIDKENVSIYIFIITIIFLIINNNSKNVILN